MIFCHLAIHTRENEIFEELVIFLFLIDAGVESKILYIGYSCEFSGAHYYIIMKDVSFFFLWL